METISTSPVADVLDRLFREAEIADRPYIEELLDNAERGIDPLVSLLEAESRDYKGLYRQAVDNFLSVTPEFGRLLYICARSRNASRVVEFGTSFGISTIHLACALRDNGGGTIIGTELEPSKAARALEHLVAAEVADFVEIRVGDALDTLRDGVGGPIDVVHLDGAFSLYLPVLRLLEPHLRPNALILAENGTPHYLDYVRDPSNGYVSLTLPFEPARGNELSVFTR
ncbi:O-methyltransferase [Mycobacterium stomatepiae]|uniref:O-methyltransferase n=1 Tax=Mycobacterium stomatepiae TaxID=470076 RepID=A0A7I7QG57_9MYCO|nr:class I SAM-dependent methyltransferase [Mycobacterium stomatepiae]MCV7164790.1 class I SAM-dependent methyltransferase [Mycobacterium stomatepiae]BBY24946.1 O-methyltransferase [Mycobacterium stomatepiae]